MGVFYNSICIPGERPDETRAALGRWLSGRGFQPTDEPILFDLDAESERSAFLVWNARWTLVFFSHWEEERRLIRELQNGLAPLLYVWVYDSDVWGWDFFDTFGFAGSFSSDREHRSFGEQTDEPRVPADADRLVARLGLDKALGPEIRKLERRQAAFKEDLCQELCQLIGAPPALSSYDELESGKAEGLQGWNVEQLLYFHYPVAKAAIDVDLDLNAYEPGSGLYPLRRPPEMSAEIRQEMEALRRRARITMLWLKPITAAAVSWERFRRWLRRQPAEPAAGAAPADSAVSVVRTETATRHWVSNHRHGIRLLLPMGADPLPVSGKPAAVFAFQAGEVAVTCTARRRRTLREVLRKPSRARIQRDEKYRIGPLPARHLLFEQDGRQPGETSWLALHVVQTEWALYVFLYRMNGEIDAEAEAVIRATVATFQIFESKLRTTP